MAEYNWKCPLCGHDAYAGAIEIKCSNKDCKNYSKEDLTKQLKKIRDLVMSFGFDNACGDNGDIIG